MTSERIAGDSVVSGSIGSLDRALDLLFHLHAASEPLGVTAAARALGLPKSSAHRLLATLARRGLVERDERGRYQPGFGLVALGLGAQIRDPLVMAARPELERAARELGETFFLCVARAGRVVVIDKAEGTGFLRAAPRVGAEVPVHATAAGRLFLAHAPERVELGAEPFEAFTPATPRTREELASRIALARARETDENRGEWIPGLWVMAAPVLGPGGMLGVVAVAAPDARMSALGAPAVGDRLRVAARRIGVRLEGGVENGSERAVAAPVVPEAGPGSRRISA